VAFDERKMMTMSGGDADSMGRGWGRGRGKGKGRGVGWTWDWNWKWNSDWVASVVNTYMEMQGQGKLVCNWDCLCAREGGKNA